MKRTSSTCGLRHFLLMAFWFATTLTAGVMYRMVVVAIYFEFPFIIILCQSVISLILFQIGKLLFPDFCKAWSTSIDWKAFPVSLLLTITLILDFHAFYQETTASNLIEYLAAPLLVVLSSGRTKPGKRLPAMMSVLSVFFTYATINVTDLSSNGILFGVSLLFSNVTFLITLRKYLANSSVSRFLFSHFAFSSVILFVFEVFKHDIHRLFLYVHLWQLPYFYSVLFSFVVCSSLSLLSLCHVITRFEISTIALTLNTKSSWQFVITNFIYRNVAFKAFYDLNSSIVLSAFAAFTVNIVAFWIDSKNRFGQHLLARNTE
ncbi:unnamed protein product [Caenorhabditis sp. 36 PRJEB53466]|nr:unnamed protein product [Caenorhabditis sp. 36 PRJEB53466]